MYYPRTDYEDISRLFTSTFYGYDHNLKIADGEPTRYSSQPMAWYDTENTSSDYFPLISQRARRRTNLTEWTNLQGIMFKDALYYIDGNYIYENGVRIEGPVLSTSPQMLPKKLIGMGAYLLVWPDKFWINTAKTSEYGYIDQKNEFVSGTKIEYSICKVDGTDYENVTVSDTAPSDPANGKVWLDTTGNPQHILKQWSETTGMWVQIPTVYVKIKTDVTGIQNAVTIPTGLKKWDGVTLSGLTISAGDTNYTDALKAQIEALNGSHVVYEVGSDYIVIVGLIDKVTSHTTTVDYEASCVRAAPDMEYITEANNRLWGCHYGLNAAGETVNEIYCCALGDFKNWTRYLGVSTDSFAASVGSDGRWTGAATYLGYPIFFKENCLHKVYVSTSGAHQIVETQCRGVMKGSGDSLKVVGERLYYLSETGVMEYDGSLPRSVHEVFGTERYKNGVAGRLLDKYYISMQDSKGVWQLFVYDTARGIWHREDSTQVKAFAEDSTELYYIDTNNALHSVLGSYGILYKFQKTTDTVVDPAKTYYERTGSSPNYTYTVVTSPVQADLDDYYEKNTGTLEDPVSWEVESGLLGYSYADHKYVTRINIRAILPEDSDMDVYMEYDSSGEWIHAGHWDGRGTHMHVFPIRPQRCDHYRIKINGTGEVKIYSIARNLEVGSDVR